MSRSGAVTNFSVKMVAAVKEACPPQGRALNLEEVSGNEANLADRQGKPGRCWKVWVSNAKESGKVAARVIRLVLLNPGWKCGKWRLRTFQMSENASGRSTPRNARAHRS